MDDRAGGGGERERTGEENEQNVLTRRSNSLLSLGPIKAVIYDHVSSMCDAAEAPSDGETWNLDGWVLRFVLSPSEISVVSNVSSGGLWAFNSVGLEDENKTISETR